MTQQQPSEETPGRDQEAARLLLEHNGWQLMTPDALAEQATLLLANTAGNHTKAMVGAYCVTLYHAFLGAQGEVQQRRACEELGQVLANSIAKHYPGVSASEREDVTQDTILRVWRTRMNCREPIAFLAFATSHLLTATQLNRRQLHRLGSPLKSIFDDDTHPETIDLAPTPIAQVLEKERAAEIEQFFVELRTAYPRASKQIDILELHLVKDIDHAEIASYLKISLETVYTKLSRIRKKLRDDAVFSQRARELGLS